MEPSSNQSAYTVISSLHRDWHLSYSSNPHSDTRIDSILLWIRSGEDADSGELESKQSLTTTTAAGAAATITATTETNGQMDKC